MDAPDGVEGAPLSFAVTLNRTVTEAVTVDFAVAGDSASEGADFAAQTGRVSIPAGARTGEISVATLDDGLDEPDESLMVTLATPSAGALGRATASGVIRDNDASPTIAAVPTAAVEGAAGARATVTVPVRLSAPSAFDVAADYAIAARSATADLDFVPASGTLSIAAGETQTFVSVEIIGDGIDEPDETLAIELTNLVRAAAAAPGLVTILDDDGQPSLTVSAGQVTEGDAGATAMPFALALSQASGADVTIAYRTVPVTATPGTDYVATSGTAVIPAGAVAATINVDVLGDTVDEADETFSLVLDTVVGAQASLTSVPGTIVDDDVVVPVPEVSAADVTIAEGAAGNVTLALSVPTTVDVSVDYTLTDVDATAGADYVAASGSVTIPVGSLSASLGVTTLDDAIDEFDEALAVVLSNPVNATLATSTANVRIADNDQPPLVVVADTTVAEGNANSDLAVAVTLDQPSGKPIAIEVATADLTATAGDDYLATTATLSFPPGTTSATVTLPVLGDVVLEADETLALQLTVPVDARAPVSTPTVTLTNDDPLPVLSASDISVAESAGLATVSVQLTGASALAASVDYATSDGTALAGADYTPASGTLQFPPGQTTASFTVPLLDDAVAEGTETFSVAFANSVAAGAISPVTVSITDDEAGIAIAVADVTVAEGNAGTSDVQVPVTLTGASAATVSATYTVTGLEATAGDDFVAATGTLTLAPGTTATSIGVAINGDTVFEPDERIQVTLSAVTNALPGDLVGEITVTNDDAEPLLAVADSTVVEGATMTFTVALNAAASADTTFTFATADGTATAGSDYTAVSGNGLIPAGNLATSIAVTVAADDLFEADETLTLSLADVVGAGAGTLVATGSIVNDDPAPEISIGSVDIAEGDGGTVVLTFPVALSAASGLPVTAAVATADVSATAGADYQAVATSLTLPAGTVATGIDVAIIGDTAAELDETFTVTLSSIAGATPVTTAATGTIRDDDTVSSLRISDVTLSEGDAGSVNAILDVTLSAAATAAVTADFTTVDGTAAAGSDYTVTSGNVSIPIGASSTTISVPVIGDTLDEADEVFSVVLTNPTGAVLVDDTGTVTIVDDDAPPTLAIADASVAEGNSGTRIESLAVTLSAVSSRDITVAYTVSGIEATAGEDFVASSGTLSFPAGTTSQAVSVSVNGDTLSEPDERIQVTLSTPVNATLADSSGVLTLTNDDAAPTLSIADASVAEGDAGTRVETLTVTLGAASAQSVSVDYVVTGLEATAGEDFTASSGTLNFAPGSTSQAVAISVNGDTLFEADERIQVTLSTPVNATLADGVGTLTLTNDDIEPTLSVADVAVAEGDAGTSVVQVPVSLTSATAATVTATYTLTGLEATAGDDFVAATGIVTVAPGETTADIAVTVNGDTVFEPNERIQITLSDVTNAVAGDLAGELTLTNDDGQPSLSVADVTVNEGEILTFTLSLDAASSLPVTVTYASSDETAVAAADYTAVSGTATIAAGLTSTTITVVTLADALDEATETLRLALSNIQNATLATPSAVGTIIDDDVAPVLSVSDALVAEGDAGTATLSFTVTLSSASGQSVAVDYATADGTATAGVDYTAASGTVTLAAGETSATVQVSVTGDVLDEADETLTLNLANAQNATLGDATGTGTITDDDATPTLSITDASVVEGDAGTGLLNFAVQLSAASGQTISVDFASSDIDAAAGSDYQATTGTLTIPAGNASASIAVTVLGDTTFEADETLTVTLSAPVNAALGTASATGTISNDDSQPVISIGSASLAEGNTGSATAVIQVTLDRLSAFPVTVDYASADGTATAPGDYLAVSGTVTVAAGATGGSVAATVVGDLDIESNETFTVAFTNASGATLGTPATATVTILDDDSSGPGLLTRPSNTTCVAPDQPTVDATVALESAFPNLPTTARAIKILQRPGDDSEWYLLKKNGQLLRFANTPSANAYSTVIDLSAKVDDASEGGLLGMAFHPDFATNGEVFLSYTEDGDFTGHPMTSIISRFTSSDGGATIDPASEEVLLIREQPFENHNGGNIEFGPDGYLYIGLGDGGSGGDPGNRAQNQRNVFGAMLRIDVDNGTPYAIPADNPNAGQPLCNVGRYLVDSATDCPEIYAYGLRNPWRWSFDTATGELWLGDVGQTAREEIDLIELGGNYGWRIQEGFICHNPSSGCDTTGLEQPVVDYGRSEGRSVTAGYVYRGTDIPALAGRFVFGDYVFGTVFAITYDENTGYGYEELLDTDFFISSFGQDQAGEVYVLSYNDARIYKLTASATSGADTIPTLLSDTGCVDAADPLQPASGLIPYETVARFWSDNAIKERLYAIPDGTQITVEANGDWTFPAGSVIVKNFELAGQRIETRLFMRHTNGVWGGYTYEWNAAETEATRVIGGKTRNVGGQTWIYPSEAQCLECHTQVAGFSLGLENAQLNSDLLYPSTGITANQLTTADAIDVISSDLGDVTLIPALTDPTDTFASLDDRARAYLHTNCAQCHQPGGPTPANIDLRWTSTLADTNTCDVAPTGTDLGLTDARIIAPGDPARSILIERVGRRDVHGMPPLASVLVDADGVTLLSDWVTSLATCP